MDESLLKNRDYTFIVARTADDSLPLAPRFADRWTAAMDAIANLAQHCEVYDPDGITLYIARQDKETTGEFSCYEGVTSDRLMTTIRQHFPPPRVALQPVLKTALDSYFARKAAGKTKANGEIILVVLDGEPSDRMAIARTIRDASNQIEMDEELGISFVQIGDDAIAAGFLSALDRNLQANGARFDIVHTKQLDQIQPDSITEFLINTVLD